MFRCSHHDVYVWLAAGVLLATGMPSAVAQTSIEWINPGTGLYHDPVNWLGGAVPSYSDTAVFDLAGASTVQWNAHTAGVALRVQDGGVTFQSLGGPLYSHHVEEAEIVGGSLTLDFFNLEVSTSPEFGGSLTVDGGGSLILLNGSAVSDDPVSVVVGRTGQGTLSIFGGSSVSGYSGTIGSGSGSTGVVTVSGVGSSWTGYGLTIGRAGSGLLNVQDGGAVTVKSSTFTGSQFGSSGQIAFSNGTLTTGELFAGSVDLTGNGIINTQGLVSDIDLVFDSTHGIQQQILLNSLPGQNVTLNLDQGQGNALGAGYRGTGSLIVAEGVVVDSQSGYLGYNAGSNGSATVTGIDSTWNSGHTYIGFRGNGNLTVENGGTLSSYSGNIGHVTGSSGTATVTGAGSSWSLTGLSIGLQGAGSLVIEDGGEVNVASSTTIGSAGQIAFDGGTLTTGSLNTGLADLVGTGTVNTSGLQIDLDLVFDATHGLQQQFTFNDPPGQDITINLDQTSRGGLGVGYSGLGTLRIAEGMHVPSVGGSFGSKMGSTGLGTVTGPGTVWEISAQLSVGSNGNGLLLIEDGASVTAKYSSIGNGPTGTGIVTVTGAASSLEISQEFGVGRNGHGVLTIADGAAAKSRTSLIGYFAGASGAVVITDPGSSWTSTLGVKVGYKGDGALTIQNGGTMSTDARFFDSLLAYEAGSSGSVTVTGAGSAWTSESGIIVGFGGAGTMTVADGGKVFSDGANIASKTDSTGSVVVTGPGSLWHTTQGFGAGSGGRGTLRIENGGVVSTDRGGGVGTFTGGTGTATVTGAGSAWNIAEALSVGNDGGEGTLYINSDAEVTSMDGVIGGGPSYRTGTGAITVSSAALTFSDRLFVGGEQARAGGDGTLTIMDGGIVNVGNTLKLWTAGTVNLVDGSLTAATIDDALGSFNFLGGALNVAVLTGDLINQGGVLAPGGDTIASTAIGGHYSQLPDAILEIEIGGPLAGTDFDLLQVTGQASLDGLLRLTVTDGFNPVLGDIFQILTAGDRIGEFSTILGQDLGNGLAFDLLYGSNRVLLEVIQTPLFGDLNNDGFVGLEDLNIVLTHWNQDAGAGNFQIGDMTGDGMVGIQDLNIILGNWLSGTPPTAGSQEVVPEPGGMVLLLLSGASLLRRCR